MEQILKVIEDDSYSNLVQLTKELTNLGHMIYPRGENLMHFAAKKNNVKMLDYLFEKGVYINHRDQFNETPFYTAAITNSVDVCLWFISKAADPLPKSYITRKTAYEVAKPDCKQEIHNYTVLFDRMMDLHRFNYKHTLANHYVTYTASLLHHATRVPKTPTFNELQTIAAHKGVTGLIDFCKEKDVGYQVYFDDRCYEDDGCTVCGRNTENKCVSCGIVRICEICLDRMSHLTDLHTKQCKECKECATINQKSVCPAPVKK